MPQRGRKSYGTLGEDTNDGSVDYLGETGPRQARKVKRRQVGVCVAGALVLCVVVLFVVAVILLVAIGFSGAEEKEDSSCANVDRFNCIPEGTPSQSLCEKRGCCWDKSSSLPQCYYPAGFGYAFDGQVNRTSYGFQANLKRKPDQPSQYGGDIETLRMDVFFETESRIRVKIFDPNSARYEVPIKTSSSQSSVSDNTLYNISFPKDEFGFNVSRKSPPQNIFATGTGFIFADQFLQLSAILPSTNVYGLGEHATDTFRLNTSFDTLTLFSRDVAPNPDNPNTNLYGVHPFYLCLEDDGNAHGVFLLNSNAMEITLQPYPSITYRTIGGILDFYFFLGPSPEAVVQQYTELIGRPYMPPYWSLGFHLCRWGYGTANKTMEVVRRMREKGIPQDTQWNDIDYMEHYLDFTYSNDTFGDLPTLVADLHDNDQRYVVITDPGISSIQPRGQYPPFDQGLAMDIFITNSSGLPIIGLVWPQQTAFPDFTNPKTQTYWEEQIQGFHSNILFDGLWIDMNEPSNFVAGSTDGCPKSSLNSPPFIPGVIRTLGSGVIDRTLCMTANQNASVHYNVHSLYGYTEAVATMTALEKVLNSRSLVISRSTYPGSGTHCGHWLGDNASKWRHMANSIPGILDFSLFGIPLVGADICGFFGNTTEELCTRWQQLGAFYPFSRNHNSIGNAAQDPAVWSDTAVSAIRDALMLRYQLLPYLYTLFHFAHTNGSTVARPLFFEFPTDSKTWDVHEQFMWGSALLISPVLTENATTVNAYFPTARWFDLRNGTEVAETGSVTLQVPLNTIPLHVKGGQIISMQEPNTTTVLSRRNPFSLLVAVDGNLKASGSLFLDDGETLNTYESGNYSLIEFTAQEGSLNSSVKVSGYSGAATAHLNQILIYGLSTAPSTVTVNGSQLPSGDFTWNPDSKVLNATVDVTNLNAVFTVMWS